MTVSIRKSLALPGDTKTSELGRVRFSGNTVADTWYPAGTRPLPVRPRQTYEEAYEALLRLSQQPGFEALGVSSGWMARREPVSFSDLEFKFVSDIDAWTLLIGNNVRDRIDLTFTNDKLSAIHRWRFPFEGS